LEASNSFRPILTPSTLSASVLSVSVMRSTRSVTQLGGEYHR
jgi:hypothetical protein